MSNQEQPTIVNLDNQNSVQILVQYVELAQQKGAFVLSEADILKRASDLLINNVPDKDINPTLAKQILVQGVVKGQRHGAYTLNDAALLNKVVTFVSANIEAESKAPPTPTAEPKQQESPSEADSLADLAEPIPLKPKEV